METTTAFPTVDEGVGGWGWTLLVLDCLAFWAVVIAAVVFLA